MTAYNGNPITVTGTPAVSVTGNPVTVSAPLAFLARFGKDKVARPVRMGVVTEEGIEWLSPPL